MVENASAELQRRDEFELLSSNDATAGRRVRHFRLSDVGGKDSAAVVLE